MPYTSKAIANSFLDIASKRHVTLCPMKMQKLVYFAHGWHLALKGDPLISEQIGAWEYGPVIESLYHALKQYGSNPITSPILDMDLQESTFKVVQPRVSNSDSYTNALLEKIWEVYGGYSAIQLSNLTHLPNTPWTNARTANQSYIKNEVIKEFFNNQREKAQ